MLLRVTSTDDQLPTIKAHRPGERSLAKQLARRLASRKRSAPDPSKAIPPVSAPPQPERVPPTPKPVETPKGRIASVVLSFPKFSETFIVDKAVRLLDHGWDVHIIATKEDAAQWMYFPELEARPDFRTHLHVSRNIGQALKELKPDLVHFEFGTMALGQMQLVEQLGCKSIVSFRGFDASDAGIEDPTYYKEVWDKADMLHVESHGMWKRLRRRGCPPDKPYVILPGAADVDTLADADRVYAGPVGSLHRPLRILSVGRLVWQKGYQYGLDAVRMLINQGIHCEYRIVGEGTERATITFAVYDAGLEHQVTLLGAMPHSAVTEQLLWADVLLQPSVTEGFGVAVIEAKATGLSVVCTDADGLPENVVDGETGFVVPKRDPRALAEKLTVLARDGALRQQFGEAGRERARTHFRIQDQTPRFEDLYRRVLDIRYRARLLSRELLAEPFPDYAPDEERIFEIERVFSDRNRHRA
jgi:glycosyltransferase involved in cell wall biosynthesis